MILLIYTGCGPGGWAREVELTVKVVNARGLLEARKQRSVSSGYPWPRN